MKEHEQNYQLKLANKQYFRDWMLLGYCEICMNDNLYSKY